MAIACLKPDPCPRRDRPGLAEPQVPADICEILKGETIPNGWAGSGFEDDNGWPTLSGSLFFDVDKDEAMAARLTERIKRLGYRATPNTTDYDQAFHRRTADADFLVLLKVRQFPALDWPKNRPPMVGVDMSAKTNVQVGWRIRSAERWSLPSYAEALARCRRWT